MDVDDNKTREDKKQDLLSLLPPSLETPLFGTTFFQVQTKIIQVDGHQEKLKSKPLADCLAKKPKENKFIVAHGAKWYDRKEQMYKESCIYGSYRDIFHFLTVYEDILKTNEIPHFYECLLPDNPVVEYYDIDAKLDEEDYSLLEVTKETEINHDNDRFFSFFKDAREDFLRQNQDVWNLADEDLNLAKYYVTTSSAKKKYGGKKNKISLHIVVRTAYHFPNMEVCKLFMKEFHKYLEENKDSYGFVFDLSVYKRNQLFRALYSSKATDTDRKKMKMSEDEAPQETTEAFPLLFFPSYIDERSNLKVIKKLTEDETKQVREFRTRVDIGAESGMKILAKYLPLLPDSCANSYDTWRNVGFAIANLVGDAGEDLFHDFSKRSAEKYSERECSNAFHNFLRYTQTSNDSKYSEYASLISLVKNHAPEQSANFLSDIFGEASVLNLTGEEKDKLKALKCEKKRKQKEGKCLSVDKESKLTALQQKKEKCDDYLRGQLTKQIKQFFNLDGADIVYDEKVEYVKPYDEQKEKCVIVKAYMGKGKTRQLIDMINKVPANWKIAVLTPRQKFAEAIYSELIAETQRDFKLYLKTKNVEDAKNLVIQVESLHKVNQEFDLIVLDEVESIFSQLVSVETHGTMIYNNHDRFLFMMERAQKILCLDAFISSRTVEVFEKLKIPYHLSVYKSKAVEREALQVPKKSHLLASMIEALKEGKKLFFFCTSKDKVQDFFLPKILEEVKNESSVLIYSSKHKKKMKDIRKEWSDPNIRIVITTSTITVGCNFDVPDIFDRIYMYVSAASKNLIRECFQGHMRVRHVRENKMFYYLDTRTVGFSGSYYRNVIMREVEGKDEQFRQIFGKRYQRSHNIFKDLYITNQWERNLSVLGIEEMMDYFLRECNYKKVECVVKKKKKEEDSSSSSEDREDKNTNFDEIKDDEELEISIPKAGSKFTYEEIKELTRTEYKELQSKIANDENSLTEMEQVQIAKYLFCCRLDKECKMSKEEEAKLWEYYNNFNKARFINLSWEKGLSEFSLEDIINSAQECGMFSDDRYIKIGIIEKISQILKLKHTQEIGATVTRQNLQKLKEELEENDIRSIFKLRMKKGGKEDSKTLKSYVAFINAILDRWGNSQLKVTKGRKVRGEENDFEVTNKVDVEVFNFIRYPKFLQDLKEKKERKKQVQEDEDFIRDNAHLIPANHQGLFEYYSKLKSGGTKSQIAKDLRKFISLEK